jgi:hypothetical protein
MVYMNHKRMSGFRYFLKMVKKVKLSLYRLWRPSGLREIEAPIYSDIGLTDRGKADSPKSRPLSTPRKIPGTHFC